MFKVQDLNISLTRGDTAALELTFTGDVPTAQDSVVMALKTTPRTDTPLWEKSAHPSQEGKVLFQFSVEDTASLQFGAYYWDVRIFYNDGQVVTPISPHRFNILEVVTDDRDV